MSTVQKAVSAAMDEVALGPRGRYSMIPTRRMRVLHGYNSSCIFPLP